MMQDMKTAICVPVQQLTNQLGHNNNCPLVWCVVTLSSQNCFAPLWHGFNEITYNEFLRDIVQLIQKSNLQVRKHCGKCQPSCNASAKHIPNMFKWIYSPVSTLTMALKRYPHLKAYHPLTKLCGTSII